MIRKIAAFIINIGRFIVDGLQWVGRLVLKLSYWALVVGIPLGVIWYLVGVLSLSKQFSDKDEYRGAASIVSDSIDEPIARENIRYLQQNWSQGESLWFYNISQGSNVMPYDFFMALEEKGSHEEFKSNENINRFRYLPQIQTKNNPDALPVGMVKDNYRGKDYIGFNCAACHTSQINYQGIGMRIDGGPAAANMEAYLSEMVAALEATVTPSKEDPDKKERFYTAVLDRGTYNSRDQIDRDLHKYVEQLKTYTQINEPVWPDGYAPEIEQNRVTHYGFSRLDAFGRIYNRVLQHIMDLDSLEEILEDHLPPSVYAGISNGLNEIRVSSDQTNIVVRVLEVLQPELKKIGKEEGDAILIKLRSAMYNAANAPVSYPYLWDISQHDFVQWTGLVSNGGLGPLGRNVGQVIGVFGTLDWQKESTGSIRSMFGGSEVGKSKLDLKSSINKVNLRRVEKQLHALQSPRWPEEYLPAIDDKLLDHGEQIFYKYCDSCHKNIVRNDPARRVIAHISKQTDVGTDPVLAMNTVNFKGNSGMLRDEYVDGNLGKLVIEKEMPVASLVKYASVGVVLENDPDRLIGFRSIEWLWGILKSLKDNPVKATAKQGNYDLPTPQEPLAPLMAYKARSLNGIWATAPYLHNGSIPNLYELLLPHKRPGDPEVDEQGNAIEYRSEQFMVGSREFDPVRVGFSSTGYQGFLFDTRIRGNSNAGHEYAAGRTAQADGTRLAALTPLERKALLEYLKSL